MWVFIAHLVLAMALAPCSGKKAAGLTPGLLDLDAETLKAYELWALGNVSAACHYNGLINCTNKAVFSFYCLDCAPCSCKETCTDDCCPGVGNASREAVPRNVQCIAPQMSDSDIRVDRSYIMTTRCPADRGSSQADKCSLHQSSSVTNYEPILPVTSKKTAKTYRNMACARCHGELFEDVSPWKALVKCSSYNATLMASREMITRAVGMGFCNVIFEPATENTETCKYDDAYLISRCNVTGKWQKYDAFLEWACQRFRVVFLRKYRNHFCFQCNAVENKLSFCQSEKIKESSNYYIAELEPRKDEGNSSERVDSSWMDTNNRCENDFVYDRFQNKCRQLRCVGGKQLVGHQCKMKLGKAKGMVYMAKLNLYAKDIDSVKVMWSNIMNLKQLLDESLRTLLQLKDVEVNGLAAKVMPASGEVAARSRGGDSVPTFEVAEMLALVYIYVNEKREIDDFEAQLVNALSGPIIVDAAHEQMRFQSQFDEDANILTDNDLQQSEFFLYTRNGMTILPVSVEKYQSAVVDKTTLVSHTLVCPTILLGRDQTKFIDRGSSKFLYVKAIDSSFSPGEYVDQGAGAEVCAEQYLLRAGLAATNQDGPLKSSNCPKMGPLFEFSFISLFAGVVVLLL